MGADFVKDIYQQLQESMLENKKLEEMNQLWASIDLKNVNAAPVENRASQNISGVFSKLEM